MDKEETLLEGMPPEYYDDVSVQIRSFQYFISRLLLLFLGFFLLLGLLPSDCWVFYSICLVLLINYYDI